MKELVCKPGGYERFVVDDIVIAVSRDKAGNARVVVHPPTHGKAALKTAVSPYECILWFGNGKDPEDTQFCDLGCEEDWGEIDPASMDFPQYGNDERGYRPIVRVTKIEGNAEDYAETEIPLRRFSEDVMDLIAVHMA